jgi:hypothetical protein
MTAAPLGLAFAAVVLAACMTETRPDPPGFPGPGEPTLAPIPECSFQAAHGNRIDRRHQPN